MNKPQLKPETQGEERANDESNITGLGMGAPPTSRGKHTNNHLPADDETTERSVLEGVEEADEDDLKASQQSPPADQE